MIVQPTFDFQCTAPGKLKMYVINGMQGSFHNFLHCSRILRSRQRLHQVLVVQTGRIHQQTRAQLVQVSRLRIVILQNVFNTRIPGVPPGTCSTIRCADAWRRPKWCAIRPPTKSSSDSSRRPFNSERANSRLSSPDSPTRTAEDRRSDHSEINCTQPDAIEISVRKLVGMANATKLPTINKKKDAKF